MSDGESFSRGCATGFSFIRTIIELPLDELLEAEEAEERMAEAYAQAHAEDMKEDGNDDIGMRYDDYPTAEGSGDVNGNGNFLQNESTIVSAAALSSQQTQDFLMSDSRQRQPQQPASESDPTANANTNANTFSHLSQTPTHSHAHAQPNLHQRPLRQKHAHQLPHSHRADFTHHEEEWQGAARICGRREESQSIRYTCPLCFSGTNSATMMSTSAAKHATATTTTLNHSLFLGSPTASGG
ncbi:hypothetical protein K503DRAFT_859906 [Rhizopogon vinicolor AM-OR11-026]|uniref:Uncharacterized protein n=1 Tax=Rhizopogon vinicolor AM-OR11-026 TaxID=1314800 RepID=A0A1B7MKV0_9AGAM|nr:hypothetical protein K503DRAFT_859906 [Rhizopogon vinicolor AM-OR11-026]